MTKFSEWSPYDRFVQAGMVDGQFVSGAYTLLASGPPRLANIGGATITAAALSNQGADQIVMPLGIIQNINLGHNKNFNRIFECGSERSYFIGGRTMGQLGLSRVQYHGPSLLRMLYAYYQDLIPPTTVQSVFPNIGAQTVANPHDVKIPPGYENLWLNLASDVFNQPFGMLMYVRDSNEDTVGAVYAEACNIPNHTWGTDSQGVIVQESAAIQFERIVPVAVSSLKLITGEIQLSA
jgi:hypothetical protein